MAKKLISSHVILGGVAKWLGIGEVLEFLHDITDEKGLTYFASQGYQYKGKQYAEHELISQMFFDLGSKVSQRTIEHFLVLFKKKARENAEEGLRNRLRYTGESDLFEKLV